LDFCTACACVIVVEGEALVVLPGPPVSEEHLGSACANPSFGRELRTSPGPWKVCAAGAFQPPQAPR
jgi:hypothetical protein